MTVIKRLRGRRKLVVSLPDNPNHAPTTDLRELRIETRAESALDELWPLFAMSGLRQVMVDTFVP